MKLIKEIFILFSYFLSGVLIVLAINNMLKGDYDKTAVDLIIVLLMRQEANNLQ